MGTRHWVSRKLDRPLCAVPLMHWDLMILLEYIAMVFLMVNYQRFEHRICSAFFNVQSNVTFWLFNIFSIWLKFFHTTVNSLSNKIGGFIPQSFVFKFMFQTPSKSLLKPRTDPVSNLAIKKTIAI